MMLSIPAISEIAAVLAIALVFSTEALADKSTPATPAVTERAHIVCENNLHAIDIEIADDHESRAVGLMHRTFLDSNAGMLFVYDKEQHVAMWMKNTIISLDMLFFDRNNIVTKIAHKTVPFSKKLIHSGAPVAAVLELNGGTSQRLGIRKGCRLTRNFG